MSAHLKHVKRTILSLSLIDKYVFVGAIVVIAGLFLPWFSVNFSDLLMTESVVNNAFTGTTFIIGYLCYFFALTAINTIDKKLGIVVATITFILFLPLLTFEPAKEIGVTLLALFLFLICNIGLIFALDSFKIFKRIPKSTINLFAGLENIVFIFVASMIYHKEALGHTSANLNFGIYTSLAGSILLFYGGYVQTQLQKKLSAKDAFSNMGESFHGGVKLTPDLSIDKTDENKNNTPEKKENSQLSFGDYE